MQKIVSNDHVTLPVQTVDRKHKKYYYYYVIFVNNNVFIMPRPFSVQHNTFTTFIYTAYTYVYLCIRIIY